MIDAMKKEFLNPSPEFSPIPFWFWNDELSENELERQILDFKSKGVDGFVIHPRIGLPKKLQYLSDEFMAFVAFAVKLASKNDMKVVLYDEGMYPSGSAHGLVVKDNPEFASRGLKKIEYPCDCNCEITIRPEINDYENIISALAIKNSDDNENESEYITRLEVLDNKITFIPKQAGVWKIVFFVECFTHGTIRGIHFGEDDCEPEAPPSGDLLNPEAMQKFINITHERYYSVLKEYFGNTIIAMFTDEPSMIGRCADTAVLPWTSDFLEYYLAEGNLEVDLPFLWDDDNAETQPVRDKYWQTLNKKLAKTYYEPISKWCEAHGISLTGHPEKSDDIGFLKYFHIPGQDIVWRWVAPEDGKGLIGEHSTMAKCSSDAARHLGRRRNSNECFGCCGPNGDHWAFSEDDMKWYLDWLFVRGVNLLYPHAFFYSIRGEKRYGERPPDVGPHNKWWPHYNIISDYIKRMSWLMTDSFNQADIAILCEDDHLPWKVAKLLFENQLEFNYLQSSLLETDACSIDDGKIKIANQEYSLVIIEDEKKLKPFKDEKLQAFINSGGVVIEKPLGNDDFIAEIRSKTRNSISFAKFCPNLRVSHVKKDNTDFFLFVNEGEDQIETEFTVSLAGKMEIWEAWNGTIQPITESILRLNRRGSLILCVKI